VCIQRSWKHVLGFLRLAALFLVVCATVADAKPPPGGPANNQSQGATQGQSQPSAAGATPSPQTPQASTASFESQVLAFEAINSIAGEIAQAVCPKVPPTNTILIYDQTSFATMLTYSAFVQNANALIGAYDTLSGSSPAANAPVATAAASGGTSVSWSPVSDLTGLLQAVAVSANNETYGSVTIPDSSVAVAVTREIGKIPACRSVSIVYPPIFGPGSNSDTAPMAVRDTIQAVNDARKKAHDKVPNAIGTGTGVGNPASTSYFATALADVDALYDNFMNSLLQPNPNSGVLGSAAVVQGRAISQLVHGTTGSASPAYILLATVLAAGGTVHDHKSFWTALGKGDHISYSGGAIVAAALWQASPTPGAAPAPPLYSDVLALRTDFKDSAQITGK
jgi:hypothetical protein